MNIRFASIKAAGMECNGYWNGSSFVPDLYIFAIFYFDGFLFYKPSCTCATTLLYLHSIFTLQWKLTKKKNNPSFEPRDFYPDFRPLKTWLSGLAIGKFPGWLTFFFHGFFSLLNTGSAVNLPPQARASSHAQKKISSKLKSTPLRFGNVSAHSGYRLIFFSPPSEWVTLAEKIKTLLKALAKSTNPKKPAGVVRNLRTHLVPEPDPESPWKSDHPSIHDRLHCIECDFHGH